MSFVVSPTFWNHVSFWGASGAFFINTYVAAHVGGRVRLACNATATLALLYAASFIWLLANPDGVVQWSQFLRPVGVLAWVFAWTWLPLELLRDYREKAKSIDFLTEKFVEDKVVDSP